MLFKLAAGLIIHRFLLTTRMTDNDAEREAGCYPLLRSQGMHKGEDAPPDPVL